MNLKSTLPIIWLPLISFWTTLFVFTSRSSFTLEEYVPFLVYILVSFLLVLQLQLVLSDKREAGIVKFGTAGVLLQCISASTFIILLFSFNILINLAIVNFLLIAPLITNIIIAELFSLSVGLTISIVAL